MSKTSVKIVAFFKRNAIYCILAFCILAVGLSVTFMLLNRDNSLPQYGNIIPDDSIEVENPDDNLTPDQPVVQIVSFIMPVANALEIGEYCETVVFNQTLGVYQAHRAVDFFAEEGSEVFAVYDGVVESVENSILQGTTICINHGNGLKTYYNSLIDGDSVVVNQKVKQGDVIGEVSVSNRQEYKDGAHLHFYVKENDQLIDPAKYLVFNEK